MTMNSGNSPQWIKDHKDQKLTVGEWLEIIADYNQSDFSHLQKGRPKKFSKELALQLYGAYANTGFMTYALEEFGLHRGTVWRWRRQYQSIHDMHILVETYLKYQKKKFPQFWRKHREKQLRVLRHKRGRLISMNDVIIGRPPIYNPSIHTDVESSLEATAEKFGVCKRTIKNWVKNYPEFERDSLIKRLQWQLPAFEEQVEELEKEFSNSILDHSLKNRSQQK
jgi:transposase-like protein